MWLTLYPKMTPKTFVSFDDFKNPNKEKEKENIKQSDKKRIDSVIDRLIAKQRKEV